MILVLDNYDSFVFNLDRYLRRLGQRTLVVRSDAIHVDGIGRLEVEAIVLSPGPKAPDDAGCCLEVVRRLGHRIPILGVCLGHQAIGQALGAKVVRAPRPIHGRTSQVKVCTDSRLLGPLGTELTVARYHSLALAPDSIPDSLTVTSWSDDGVVMSVEHSHWPLYGVQFHPESILTEAGLPMVARFLDLAGLPRITDLETQPELALPQQTRSGGSLSL
ncbi:MAG: anthranilate synthase component II [Pirellulaceae bacterium]|jgi:anthranilate synthase/aminodeoxychorismate synthase-like glutamine amidotransferase